MTTQPNNPTGRPSDAAMRAAQRIRSERPADPVYWHRHDMDAKIIDAEFAQSSPPAEDELRDKAERIVTVGGSADLGGKWRALPPTYNPTDKRYSVRILDPLCGFVAFTAHSSGKANAVQRSKIIVDFLNAKSSRQPEGGKP